MKEQLLSLIKKAELLRAQMDVDGTPGRTDGYIDNAIDELYWCYQELTQYE